MLHTRELAMPDYSYVCMNWHHSFIERWQSVVVWEVAGLCYMRLNDFVFSSVSSNDIPVTITTNETDGIICLNHSIKLTCHVINGTTNTTYTYKWTSSNYESEEINNIITVTATNNPVLYICLVSDGSGNSGYSNINISSNGKLMSSK